MTTKPLYRGTKMQRKETAEQAAFRITPSLAALNQRWQQGEDLGALAPAIIQALEGNGDAFILLDSKPGYFDGYSGPRAYHSMLRNIRNSPVHGPAMFASFRN